MVVTHMGNAVGLMATLEEGHRASPRPQRQRSVDDFTQCVQCGGDDSAFDGSAPAMRSPRGVSPRRPRPMPPADASQQ